MRTEIDLERNIPLKMPTLTKRGNALSQDKYACASNTDKPEIDDKNKQINKMSYLRTNGVGFCNIYIAFFLPVTTTTV